MNDAEAWAYYTHGRVRSDLAHARRGTYAPPAKSTKSTSKSKSEDDLTN